MKGIKELLNFVAWIFTVLLQIVGGMVGGYLMFAEGYGSLIYMWFGMTMSIFGIGALAILFRPAITPKNYILRLGLVAAVTAVPLVIFYFSPLFFYNADYETPPEFPFLATIMGVACFYSLGRLKTKFASLKNAKVISYGSSILVLLVGLYALWDWYSPVSLPIKYLERYDSLNMKLEDIIGDGFWIEVVRGNYVYGNSDHRLMVLDISNPENIFLAGRSEVIPGDVQRVNLFEDYAYITAGSFGSDVENKIHVVDVSDPAKPRYLASYDLSGKYIWNVKTFGKYLYIIGCIECTQSEWDQHALYILDLTNPSKPIEIGHYFSDTNISDVAVFGDYAYLTLDEEGAAHPGMRVLDVSDPKEPEKVQDLFPSARGVSVTVSVNRLYFNGGKHGLNGLHIMDISNPGAPREIAFHPEYATIFSGNSGYIVHTTSCGCSTTDVDDPPETEFTIMDYSDPERPRKSIFEFEAYSVDIQGNTGFYWDSTTQTFTFLDFSDPDKPVKLGSYGPVLGNLFDLTGEIFVDGEYGVIPTEEMGLYIFDFSSPTKPIFSNLYDVGDYYWVEEFNKNHVYLSVDNEIQVLDISNPQKPSIVWRYDSRKQFVGVSIRGEYAYLAYEVDGLFVYDISNPASPVLINHQPELNGFRDIDGFDSSGRYFFSFDRNKTRVFDASDPLKIVEVGLTNKDGYHETTIVDDLAFLDDSMFNGAEPATVSIFDLSDPQNIDRVAYFGWHYDSKVTGVSKDKIFIGSLFDGLHLMDFSNPKNPKELGFYGIEEGTSGLAIGQDNIIYLISEDNDLYVIRYLPPVP